MKAQRQLVIKPAVLNDILKLPSKEAQQVNSKIDLLMQDPRPDSKVKKQLVHMQEKLFRIRSGDYRIFYTFNQEAVSVLKIDRRDESTYSGPVSLDHIPHFDDLSDLSDLDADELSLAQSGPLSWEQPVSTAPTPQQSEPLSEPITSDLLDRLRIPAQYHQRLSAITTTDDLLNCQDVDASTLNRLIEYLYPPSLPMVMQQPDLVVNETDDLLRFREGELLTFLLKLSPEQERFAAWSTRVNGPTLVKGSPGTGKSTVALYRIHSLLKQNEGGPQKLHVLFTTYTNALVASSRQLLQHLLGSASAQVAIATVDATVYRVLQAAHQERAYDVIDKNEQLSFTRQAIADTAFEGNALQQQAARMTIERMGPEYLLEEFNTIIVARQLDTLAAYQETARVGRSLRLSATQRVAVWQVYQQWSAALQATGKESWEQRRARAAKLVAQTPLYRSYDAVVIDEAQDLDPSVLRLLVQLCNASNRLFITADANQSIYGAGFSWSSVHSDLKFQGRTNILRSNYRSTAEISAASLSYLASGLLDPEITVGDCINHGPLPAARSVRDSQDEARLLADFFKNACHTQHLALGSCAILCPSEQSGRAIASALCSLHLPAAFMPGRDLKLEHPGIKVLTLKSSKGLEFPIVALAGFTGATYPYIPKNTPPEEQEELFARERRTMFVGMTRAMRALLVVVPFDTTNPLLQGFDPTLWNLTQSF